MPKPQGECPFCDAPIALTRATTCKSCGTAYPKAWAEAAFSQEAHDSKSSHVLPAFEDDETEEEFEDEIVAIFTAARYEGWRKRHTPYVDAADRMAIAQAKLDRQWNEIAAKAQALAARQPWTLHEGGGYCFLKRWVNRTEELRRISPPSMESPRVPPVFGQVGTLGGKPFIVPMRRKAELQKVLDEHEAGLRLADLVRSRSRRGRRHRKEERKQVPEWEQDREKIILTKALLKAKYPQGRVDKNDPDAIRYAALRMKWRDSKKCHRENCMNFIPRYARRDYCTDACKARAKKAR